MTKERQKLLAQLPSVDFLLKQLPVEGSHALGKEKIHTVLEEVRQKVLAGEIAQLPSEAEIIQAVEALLKESPYSLKRVINGTGTVLHTNLGRASLSSQAQKHMEEIALHYSNLEFNLETGQRGSRYSHLVEVVQKLTGAEDVLVVNNNAAAVLLALHTFASQKEVLVSRGELVEIGGAFRIPEVITASGGKLIDVGTTNRTYVADYRNAITEETGALLKVHTSNYRVIGFTEETPIEELAALAQEKNLPLINDLGSGLLLDMRQFGLPYEPTIQEALAQGSDIVTFSGDKLLGGPQAGIIVGKKKYIAAMKKNQMLRALRIDKLTLAAIEATLTLYLDPQKAIKEVPMLQMLAQTGTACQKKAEALAALLKNISPQLTVTVLADQSKVGGGSYPEYLLPTYVVNLTSTFGAAALQEKLRGATIPIISRIKNEGNYLDLRTIDESEFSLIEASLREIF